jgi:dCTP deaminase
MIINGKTLYDLKPLDPMIDEKRREHGVSYGLTEAGYDVRVKQEVIFYPQFDTLEAACFVDGKHVGKKFAISSTIERFQMPPSLMGIVHDKSTWARRGLSVFNTVIEPKWEGWLTLELVYHGSTHLHIPAGAGIAQVIFHQLIEPASYDGKYQNQPDEPVEAILE